MSLNWIELLDLRQENSAADGMFNDVRFDPRRGFYDRKQQLRSGFASAGTRIILLFPTTLEHLS